MVKSSQNEERVPLSTWSARFWGRSAELEKPIRIAALVFVAVAILSMAFLQLGFWTLGAIGTGLVHFLLLLVPVAVGAYFFGPLTGMLLGLLAGVAAYVHAMLLPLDFFEYYFVSELNAFTLFVVAGAIAGWLFDVALRSRPVGKARMARILAVCVVVSLVASLHAQLNTWLYYSGTELLDFAYRYVPRTPLGIIGQIIVDAILMFLFCSGADRIVRKICARGSDRKLHSVFGWWLLTVSFIAFMFASGVVFTAATIRCADTERAAMFSDIDYLAKQLESRNASECKDLLDGYEVELDGQVAITDWQGIVLASDDDEELPVGASIMEKLGFEPIRDSNAKAFGDFAEKMMAIAEVDDSRIDLSSDITYYAVGPYDNGYVVILRPYGMVYRNRSSTMVSITLLAVILIASIAIIAYELIRRVVIRRIDETNDSLDKIIGGDLSERVQVYDSREFTSLSTGINSTVSALKDSIAEVEQRNARELATAKAIQESVLPTEFPPFPEIDRFDIYASMKTAKEVGGDFYDFFLIDGAPLLGFVMADVSGKGIPAALFMMTAKTQIRNYMESGLPVAEAVNAANHQLCLGNEAGMFVTMIACVLNYETGELAYVNAGHNPPLLLHDGKWCWKRDVSGMPLGVFDGIPYDQLECVLDVDDVLYLYTDGVTEAMDASGALFSEERLEETLCKYADLNPRSICVGVRRAITDFTLDCEQSDDITMLGLKYGVSPETRAVMELDAKTDQLVHVCNYIHAELHRRHAPDSVRHLIDIAAEELFVNVCHYAYPDATPDNPGKVCISFEYEANPPSLTVQISDNGIPYNPLEKPDAVTPDDIEDVPIGGLGILMAKKSVDEMSYERVDGSNVLTFKKGW